MSLDNLGQHLYDAGFRNTTYFDGAGKRYTGAFAPAVRLFDVGGTEVPGAFKIRYGIDPSVPDPHFGMSHAPKQALLAPTVQAAINASAVPGITPGTLVSGPTFASGYHAEALNDVAALLLGQGVDSPLWRQFSPKDTPFDGPKRVDATSLRGLMERHKWRKATAHDPRGMNPEELLAAGIDRNNPEDLDAFWQWAAGELEAAIAAGTTTADAEPAAGNSWPVNFTAITFLRWAKIVRETLSKPAAPVDRQAVLDSLTLPERMALVGQWVGELASTTR